MKKSSKYLIGGIIIVVVIIIIIAFYRKNKTVKLYEQSPSNNMTTDALPNPNNSLVSTPVGPKGGGKNPIVYCSQRGMCGGISNPDGSGCHKCSDVLDSFVSWIRSF